MQNCLFQRKKDSDADNNLNTTDSHLSDLVGLEMAMTFSTHIMTPGVSFIVTSAVETLSPEFDCHLAASTVESLVYFLCSYNEAMHLNTYIHCMATLFKNTSATNCASTETLVFFC